MEHPSHKCEEIIPNPVVMSDGRIVNVPIKLVRCKMQNGRTQPMRKRGRRTRYEPEKPKRCVCGKLQKHCQTTRARCSCGHLQPCGMTMKRRKGEK